MCLRLASGLHKYLYAHAAPISFIDPSGNCAAAIRHNLSEYSKIGIEVHQFIQEHYSRTSSTRSAENSVSEILNGESPKKRVFSGTDGSEFRKRVDLYDLGKKTALEIKPVLQKFNGAVQLNGYVTTLDQNSFSSWDTGGMFSYKPPTSYTTKDGFIVKINPVDGAGVITYSVGCGRRQIAKEATAAAVAYGITRSLLRLQSGARAGAFAGIQGRLALSAATGGRF